MKSLINKNKFTINQLIIFSLLLFISCGESKPETEQNEAENSHQKTDSDIIYINQEKQKISGIEIEQVGSGSFEFGLNMTGKIVLNEKKHELMTARVSGRVESVFFYSGDNVKQGETLLEIYSQEFLLMQNEFLQSVSLKEKKSEESKLIYSAAYLKLLGVGLNKTQIQKLETSKEISRTYEVKSPIDGIILEHQIIKGQTISIGDRMMDVSDLSNLWVIADVFDVDLPNVKIGQQSVIRVNAYPHTEFSGKVESILGSIDEQTRTGKMRLLVNNQMKKLKPNMFCTVEIKTQLTDKTLKIPYSSVLEKDAGHFVFTALSDTSFSKQEIKIGHENAQFVEVIDGLKIGTKIVTHGTFYLKSEMEKDSFNEEHE